MREGSETFQSAIQGATCDHCQLRQIPEADWASYVQEGTTPFMLGAAWEGVLAPAVDEIETCRRYEGQFGLAEPTDARKWDNFSVLNQVTVDMIEELDNTMRPIEQPSEHALYPILRSCVDSNVADHCAPLFHEQPELP
ncbi:MAG TPA: hypothetical protein VJP80_04475 [Candidatus Saccharimonadales bacterium]|nr:hypothetical protein [Candidatus Saccharimonadales bacterium]